jgi:ribulose-phosphate 3-epimerase
MGNEVKSIINAGAEFVHFDVMDGRFVPNIFFAPDITKSLRKFSNILFDIHLMVTDPINHIERFALSGADIISFHVESKSDVNKTINSIKKRELKPGIVINPKTLPEEIIKYINDDVYMIVIMGVEPGFSGQKFIPETTEKVARVKQIIEKINPNILIEVDGGVGEFNIKKLREAGADVCVSGSYVFSSKDRKKAIKLLKDS